MLTFDEANHAYFWDGNRVPSVTTIPNLVATRTIGEDHWNAIGGDHWMQDEVASAFGREFHSAADIILDGDEPDCDPLLIPWLDRFHSFISDHKDIIKGDIASLYVLDWKTGTSIQKTSRMQTAAYTKLIQENPTTERRITERRLYSHSFRYAGTLDFASGDLSGKARIINRWTVRFDLDKPKGYVIDKRSKSDSEDWNNFLSLLNVLRLAA